MAKQPTLREFLEGAPLRYRGVKDTVHVATYRTGDGIYIDRNRVDVGKADIADDAKATAFYWNCVRAKVKS